MEKKPVLKKLPKTTVTKKTTTTKKTTVTKRNQNNISESLFSKKKEPSKLVKITLEEEKNELIIQNQLDNLGIKDFKNHYLYSVYNYLTLNQKIILKESLEKEDGALALPMGSGKTILSLMIGLIFDLKYNKNVIYITTKSLIPNLLADINKFFGDMLEYEVLHTDYSKNLSNWIPKKKLVITTYNFLSKYYKQYRLENKLVNMTDTFPPIKNYNHVIDPLLDVAIGACRVYAHKWSAFILDESQDYYNINSVKCLSLVSICSYKRWLLSGTLISEPRIHKIFGYYLLLNDSSIPRNLPDFEKFTKESFYLGIKSTSIYREKNEDYVPPKVNYHIINHELCNEEILIYRNIKKIINDLNKELNRFKLLGDTENTKKFNSYLLSMITNLRQFIIQPIYPIAKMIVQMSKMGKKDELAIRFNQSIEELDINEWLDDEKSAFSSRLQNIFKIIEKHKDEKLIIFGCFKKFLHVIVHYLLKNKIDRDLFMLNNNIQSREKTINDFEKSKNGIILLTYDIGSQGFNFQHCKNVLLIDLWWNYDKIKQAMCRIVRPGQLQETNVYFFISNIGIEHALLKMQKQKLNLAKKYFEGGSITDKIDRIKIQNIIKFLNEENYELLTELNEEDLY